MAIQTIKNYINSYRDIGNWKSGWFFFLPQHFLAGDKQQHALKGSFFLTSYIFMIVEVGLPNLTSYFVNLIICALFSLLYELNQKKHETGTFDYKDVVADCLGYTVVVIIVELIRLFEL